jgi:hypothetical protein
MRPRARYVRSTPGSRLGTVEIRCEPTPEGGTAARVIYDLTALSPAGRESPATFEAGYAEMLASWARAIAGAQADHFAAGEADGSCATDPQR